MALKTSDKVRIGTVVLGGAVAFARIGFKHWMDQKKIRLNNQAKKELYDYKNEKELELYKAKLKMNAEAKEKEQSTSNQNADTSFISPIAENPNEILNRQPRVLDEPMLYMESVLRNRGVNWFASRIGQGKSIITAQLGIEAASGHISKLLPCGKGNSFSPMRVVLYDVELDDDDIYGRYLQDGFKFPENYSRVTDCEFPSEKYLLNDIRERVFSDHSDCAILIDNITSICPTLQAEKVKAFNSGLRKIQREANEYCFDVTFFIVAHTTKGEAWEPITENSFAGSVQISRSATSMLTLEPTRLGDDVKMLKVVKCRNMKKSENVAIVRIEQKPYLHFEFVQEMKEEDALPIKPKAKKDAATKTINKKKKLTPENINEIKRLNAESVPVKEIAAKFHVSSKTIYQYVK